MPNAGNILVIEDESGLVMTLTDRLEAEGYRCDSRTDGITGAEAARSRGYDAILLDVMLPGKSGFDVCRELRAAGDKTPVLMLTARGQVDDRVLGLKIGADDYLSKPFDMAELLARVEALIRRAEHSAPQGAAVMGKSDAENARTWERAAARGRVDYGAFVADFSIGTIERSGEIFSLSGQEYKLLAYLSEHPNEIFSRDRLLDAVWGYGSEVTTRTVDVHVAWLRRKIGDAELIPRHILTIRGLGYRFVP
ncbi:MAG: response regulator transcription factor [Treponemataceae bacterium]